MPTKEYFKNIVKVKKNSDEPQFHLNIPKTMF